MSSDLDGFRGALALVVGVLSPEQHAALREALTTAPAGVSEVLGPMVPPPPPPPPLPRCLAVRKPRPSPYRVGSLAALKRTA